MVKMPDGTILLFVKFIHPYDTFYREDYIRFYTDKLSHEDAINTIMQSKLTDKFCMLTSAQLVLDTNKKDEVFITIVAPYHFPDPENDSNARLVTAVINYFTDLVWNKMKSITDKVLFEECYQEILEGKRTPINLVTNMPWLFKRNKK